VAAPSSSPHHHSELGEAINPKIGQEIRSAAKRTVAYVEAARLWERGRGAAMRMSDEELEGMLGAYPEDRPPVQTVPRAPVGVVGRPAS
jgi:hypothetical protein